MNRNFGLVFLTAVVVVILIATSPTAPKARDAASSLALEKRLGGIEERLSNLQVDVSRLQQSQASAAAAQRALEAAVSRPAPRVAASAPVPVVAAEGNINKNIKQVDPLWPGGPTEVHEFDSGVRLWAHFLRKAQRERFALDNLWEKLDEPLITQVLQQAEPGDVFIDCGAALGYYSLLARRLSPDIEIHSFNPHPKFVERMKFNIKLNGATNINIHQLAIADKPMQGVKITSAGFGGRIQPNKMGDINTTTLNEFLPTIGKNWKRLLLVKADVEGFELKMLSAATDLLGVVQNWVIAIHQTREACGQMLKQHNYEVIAEDPVRVAGEPNGVLVATLDKAKYFPAFEVDKDA